MHNNNRWDYLQSRIFSESPAGLSGPEIPAENHSMWAEHTFKIPSNPSEDKIYDSARLALEAE